MAAVAPAPTAVRAHTPRVPSCGIAGAAFQPRAAASGTIALSADETRAVAADTDNNRVVILRVKAGVVSLEKTVATGPLPTHVVMGSDGRVFVTERGSNSVSEYNPATGAKLCTTQVASDPVALALAPDEKTVYVTSGIGRTLTALNTQTFETQFTMPVGREPRGIAIAPDGKHAFLSHLAGKPMSVIALDARRIEALADPPIPQERRLDLVEMEEEAARLREAEARRAAARDRYVCYNQCEYYEKPGADFAPKPAARAMEVVGARDVPVASASEVPRGMFVPRPSQAWSVRVDPVRNEALVAFMVSRTGKEVPHARLMDIYGGGSVAMGPEHEKVSLAIARYDIAHARWTDVVLPERAHGRSERVRIPSAIASRPDGTLAVVSMGTNMVSSLRGAEKLDETGLRPTVSQPCGMVVTRDGTEIVFSQMAHAVETKVGSVRTVLSVGESALDAQMVRGRALFHSARDARIAAGGLSCAGCHPDGRDDGLVWFLKPGPRQTPTLAARLVAPFNWNGSQPTMEGNVVRTVHRLGGSGLPRADVEALSAYVLHGIRDPGDVVARAKPEDVDAGRALFMGQAACGGCHDPNRNFTDGLSHELGGLGTHESQKAFDTPSLRFLGSTSPYFHDGRYLSIEELLIDPAHGMGRVDRLSNDGVRVLAAYLRSL